LRGRPSPKILRAVALHNDRTGALDSRVKPENDKMGIWSFEHLGFEYPAYSHSDKLGMHEQSEPVFRRY
jgi:hypothetical protein